MGLGVNRTSKSPAGQPLGERAARGKEHRGGLRKSPRYIATRLLAIRPRSVGELRERLLNKGFAHEAVEDIVTEFRERGLLNDAVFARALAESWLRRRAVGRRFLLAKLKQHRLAPSLVAEIIQDLLPPGRERTLAVDAVKKLLPVFERRQVPRGQWRTRTIRHLLQRGFSSEVVTDIVDTFL